MSTNLKKLKTFFKRKRFFSLSLFLSLFIFLAGCLQNHTVIIVKPDGAGVIEETVLFSNMMFKMMDSFTAGVKDLEKKTKDESAGETPESKDNSEKKAKETSEEMLLEMTKGAERNAAQFGEQVKLVSVSPVKTASANGYRAVYAFSNIGQIRINQNPGNKLDEKNAEKGAPSREEFIIFKFTKGSPARLVVTFPDSKKEIGNEPEVEKKDKSGEVKSDAAADKESLDMLKTIFQELKLSTVLRLEGAIVKSNASYQEGSKITLMEMDFAKIIDNIKLLKLMNYAKPNSLAEVKSLLRDVPGLKIEYNNPVMVDFR